MMKSRTSANRRRGVASWVLIAAALCCCTVVGVAAAAAGQPGPAVQYTRSTPLFPSVLIGPGSTLTGSIRIPSNSAAGSTPYLRFVDVEDSCVASGSCRGPASRLSDQLVFRVRSDDNRTWQGNIAALTRGVTLPGAPMPAQASAHYVVTAKLPATATNSVASRVVTFNVEYGVQDSAGHPETRVLGEGFAKPGSAGGAGSSGEQGSLPFTGSPLVAELGVAAALASLGAFALIAGRRRRSGDPS
jgi:hypothetical protein